jgi:hypothetical protein
MTFEDYFEIDGTYELVDGLYDVKGSVALIKRVDKLPFKFGTVSDDFYCGHNNLTSLEGCPKQVGGFFYCGHNNLISLKGSPNWVGGNFRLGNNKLTSLKGSPNYIGGDFDCDVNLKGTKEYRQYLIFKKLRS